MFSRFWYFVLAAMAATGVAMAFVAQDAVNRGPAEQIEEQLRRDRVELELWLRYDARLRLDAIAPMAAHADVRSALRSASARRDRSSVDGNASSPTRKRKLLSLIPSLKKVPRSFFLLSIGMERLSRSSVDHRLLPARDWERFPSYGTLLTVLS